MTLHTTLSPEGASLYSAPLEGWEEDPQLVVWCGPLDTGRKYVAFWEKPEPTIDVLYASGQLSLIDDKWQGDIVSVRRGKVRSWRATAERGSATIVFEEQK